MQRTIEHPVEVSGIGLHTGYQVTMQLRPAPAHTGIVFRRVDLRGFQIEAKRQWVSRVVLATTLMKHGVMLSTVEHLLSALYGLQIDNLYIDIDSMEVPIMDGSAQPFVDLVEEAGISEQGAEKTFLMVEKTLRLDAGQKYIVVEPAGEFFIEYEIDFPHPLIGRQRLDLQVTPESYRREIAFARTFGFYSEVEELKRKGLIRGGSLDNAVVLSESDIMNDSLRSADEFVRHKVLDLIGDLSLCGYPVVGRIRAFKAGHALHTHLATALTRNGGLARRVRESRLPAETT
ncbi:MAG TPA: UDP-3-O-acyl-N-acetylglucosamine deacetylase [Acidobacteriota bacterium]|nr:UDP-3-O-acyl-N-acetylglucosamine deacetylase [Acidobacteriota bacterium]